MQHNDDDPANLDTLHEDNSYLPDTQTYCNMFMFAIIHNHNLAEDRTLMKR